MASITAPATVVPLFNIIFDGWLGGRMKPVPPKEPIYKQRIDCLNSLARIQDDLRRADEEYCYCKFCRG